MHGEHRNGLIYSAALHIFLLLLMVFGLPSFMHDPLPPQPVIVAVDILPISQVTNVKPSDEPLAKEEKPEPKKEEKPTPPKPPEPKAEPKPEPLPEPKKEEPKKEEKKEEPKKEEPKKEEVPKKASEKDLERVLKRMAEDAAKKKQAEKQEEESKKKAAEDTGTKIKAKNVNYDPGQPLSMSELDAIRSQISKCWNAPAGAKDVQNLQVTLHVRMAEDGTVLEVGLADESKARYGSDSYYRAAADSAMRAMRLCSPLKNLPADKFQTWQDMLLTFDPKDY